VGIKGGAKRYLSLFPDESALAAVEHSLPTHTFFQENENKER
jgi:hypothetical protein